MRRVLLCVAVVVLAGCGSSSAPQAAWNGPPNAKPDGTLAVAGFNDFLAKSGQNFAKSPIMAVAAYLRLDNVSARTTSLVSTTPGEVRDQAMVVATLDGLLDDSVRAVRYTIELQRNQGVWRLVSAKLARVCQAGRGHAAFSTKPCV